MNNLNSLLNQRQVSSLQEEIHNHGQSQLSSSTHFDSTSSHDDFLEQMLSSVPSSAASFPWVEDQQSAVLGHVGEQSAAVLASKMRQHQISNGAARGLMLQQQLLLSRNLAAANDLRSPTGADTSLLPMPQGDPNDVVDGSSFKSAIPENDASIKSMFNGFTGLLGQNPNQTHHFHHNQTDIYGVLAAVVPAVSQPAAGGGGVAGQPRQRVRARRGQATDPHSIAERLRRERIAERMKALQELVPNANKTDKASMLDEIIDYVKFLQLQVKVLSMSRLGGAAAVTPLLGDTSSQQGKSDNGAQTASSSQNNDGMTAAEQQVAKLMEEDMGSAMQYLQGKGLCLMPISLATAISTVTCRSRNPIPPPNNPLLNGEARGPASPSMSVLTVQSATIGGGTGGGESYLKEATSVSKP